MPRTAKAQSSVASLQDHLSTAHADLVEAEARLREILLREGDSLASDAAYTSWTRERRLAENEQVRIRDLIVSLEAQSVIEEEAQALAAFEARYNAAADQNDEVAEMFRTQLPEAWRIIAHVLEQAALAEIETEAVRSAMPENFHPKRWLGNPDRSVRCRPPCPEKVISEQTVELWVDQATGNIFADQSSAPKDKRATKRRFKEVTYRPFRPSGDAAPFYSGLSFPRLGNDGDPLFDGTKLKSPRAVLAELAKARSATDAPAVLPVKRITPLATRH